jgi:two-component system chemotaxis response regulator CheY
MSKRILAVDDSASVRQLQGAVLSAAGYEVVQAVDGKDALTQLEKGTFNLILTDLNMPNLDGIGLIKAVRGGKPPHKTVPIIMLTTESQETRKQEGKAAGATGWIVKPFAPDQLVGVVKKVIG